MRRKFDLYEIQVPYKYESLEECDRKIKALIEFIKYHVKEKEYFCQGIIVSSDTKSDNLLSVKKEKTNKKGRPRTLRVINNYKIGKLETDAPHEYHFIKTEAKEIKVRPHIHMFFLLNPSATFAEIIRVYVKNNWEADSIEVKKGSSVRKRNKDKKSINLNMGFTEYFINQASTIRFINENHSKDLKDFPSKKYNFKTYYRAYVNYQSYIWNKEDLANNEGYKKSVLKYQDQADFYNNVRNYEQNK